LNKMIGMNPKMFKHIVALNTYTQPFLSLHNNEQQEIIEQLLGIQLLSEKADILKTHIKRSKEDIALETARLEGLKIRVMESVTAMDMVKSLGGSPTPISWGELYTSLQQGVVDGAENNPPSFYLSRHYEVCKYYSLDEHTVLPDVLIAGTHLWNQLSSEEKKWLQQAVNNSVVYQRKLWAEAEEEALKEVQKAGVTVIRPDKTLFSDNVDDVYEQYSKDKEMLNLIERIKKTN